MIKRFTIKKLTLVLIALMFSIQGYSQISGSKTIGGSSPDYATMTDAVAALNSLGISGQVVFNIRPGAYIEQLTLNAITGTSVMNNVIFQSENGDSTSVVLGLPTSASSTDNFVIKLNGCDFVSFRRLTFERTGTNTYSRIIEITNGSDDVSFQNCVFNGTPATTSTTNNSIFYSASGTTSIDNNLSILNSILNNGSYGLYLYGASTTIPEIGMIISNNLFKNQYGRAINIANNQSTQISGNLIETNSTNTSYYGIWLSYASKALQIRKNKITGAAGGYGIYLTTCIGDASGEGVTSNNFIQLGSASTTAYGIYATGCQLQSIYYNSISINSSNLSTGRALMVLGTTSQKIEVKNNILANLGGGYAFYCSAPAAITNSNYNDLYSTGINLGYWGTADVTSLAAWKSASLMDNNSISVDPGFVSLTDLHVSAPSLNNAAQPIGSITTDIDGESRSTTTPDIGADEFTPLTDNIGLVSVIDPANGNCGTLNATIRVVLKNFGSLSQTNIPVTVDVTGATTASYTATYTGSLATSASDTIIISTSFNTTVGGTFDLKCYSSLANDQNRTNDTIYYSFASQALPVEPTLNAGTTVCPGPVSVSVTPAIPTDLVYWFDAAVGGNQVHIGDTLNTTATASTNYYVEARAGGNTAPCLRITEVEVGTNDFIEIQNMSTGILNATGWIVGTSNSYTDINIVNANIWTLGTLNAGEIQYKTDATTDNYWGSNLFYSPGSPGWVVIMDNTGAVIDFLAWQWTDAQIQAMSTTIGGFPFTPGTQWSGNGAISCANGSSITRQGTSDNNNVSDFICATPSKNVQNTGLTYPFTNCGVGACPSIRVMVPVDIYVLPLLALGNDTTISVGSSITLDAGPGFVSYLWNDNSTAQTLTTNAAGTYIVNVVDANGCANSDTIVVNLNIGINELSGKASMLLYPNPASSVLNIDLRSNNVVLNNMTIENLAGQVVVSKNISKGDDKLVVDLSALKSGIYFVNIHSAEGSMRQKLVIQ